MDYFPPKTKIDFHFGPPIGRTRRGFFEIEEINNQYNNHYYFVFLSQMEDGHYRVSITNRVVVFDEGGFETEQDAANALDAFVAKLKIQHLRTYSTELSEKLKDVNNNIEALTKISQPLQETT